MKRMLLNSNKHVVDCVFRSRAHATCRTHDKPTAAAVYVECVDVRMRVAISDKLYQRRIERRRLCLARRRVGVDGCELGTPHTPAGELAHDRRVTRGKNAVE